ncbi:MAG: LamG-like jellyroll fold domain-containing protein [Candidatus Paceibacterota bacterium]|jgi:prepilin-type N-terminal cleavage/methylation domain-containing protein
MNKRLIAFTLIELLVVIAIVGILSGLIIVGMNGMTNNAKIAKAQVFSNSLRNALMMKIVSEWKFDNGTLGNSAVVGDILDTWGENNAVTVATSPGPIIKGGSDCVYEKCLSFDGNDYIDIAGSNLSTSDLAITGEITLSVWVKFNQRDTTQSIIGRGNPLSAPGDYGYALSRYGGNNRIYFDNYSTTARSYANSNAIITDTNWHFIVATWDGTTNLNGRKIYIDGVLDKQDISTISFMGQPNYYFRIGETGNGLYPINGLIDDIRVYNVVVPISQIKEQYYAGMNSLVSNGGLLKEEYGQRIGELTTAQNRIK